MRIVIFLLALSAASAAADEYHCITDDAQAALRYESDSRFAVLCTRGGCRSGYAKPEHVGRNPDWPTVVSFETEEPSSIRATVGDDIFALSLYGELRSGRCLWVPE